MKISAIRKATLLTAATIAASALVPTSAWAAETFNFTNSYTSVGNSYGNVLTFTGSAGTKVEVSAYSAGAGNSLTSSQVIRYNPYGLGVTSRGNDTNHAIDNNSRVDYVVLQFDKVMSVSDLGIYGFGDTDLIWAVGSTTTSFAGALSIPNYTTLDNLFDALMTSTGSSTNNLVNRSVNPSAASGNLFLVAAAPNSNSNDAFKLRSLTATASAVPEPATWGMMICGLGLAGAMMRRRKASTTISFA